MTNKADEEYWNSLYTGIAKNVEQRFIDHQNGKGAKYTRSHSPVKIIYTEKSQGVLLDS